VGRWESRNPQGGEGTRKKSTGWRVIPAKTGNDSYIKWDSVNLPPHLTGRLGRGGENEKKKHALVTGEDVGNHDMWGAC